MDNSAVPERKILIVDDSAINRSILSDILNDKYTILEACDGIEAIQMIKKHNGDISLMLLDLVMPNMDGFEVLAAMNRSNWIEEIPVIMISAENSPTYVERAFELGVNDFIIRPFNVALVRRRVSNIILLYTKQKNLISLVSQQVYEKEKNNNLMINILSHIVEFRNGESGLHILHVNTITEVLLKRLVQKTDRYNLSFDDIETIVTASSLHDIGKISVPDEILNKPGRLTPEEFEIVKGHSRAGADMLGKMTEYLNEPLVKTAYDICLYHHERYDGKGYPTGKSGDDIPVSAQVVSIADVYDALTSERCYKQAIPHKKAIEMINNGECGCFNPLLLECLSDVSDMLEKELKINSFSKRNLHNVTKMTEEMLHQNKFSSMSSSINALEQSRIKYEFFASISREIQFEYTESPPVLSISEWCTELFNLPSIIVNPFENEKIIEIAGGIEMFNLFKSELRKTSISEPATQFEINMLINGEKRLHRVYCRVNWSNEEQPQIISVIGKVVDIEEDNRKLIALRKEASHDALTNIYNHGYAETLVKEKLKEGVDSKYAMAIMDLDDFKSANDTYGHMFGDTVLKTVADKLLSCTRKDDIVARIGGDEFLLFIEYTADSAMKVVTERIYAALNSVQCGDYNVHVSMGIATTQQTGYDYDALFNAADSALYYTKKNGKSGCNFYNKTMKLSDASFTPIEN